MTVGTQEEEAAFVMAAFPRKLGPGCTDWLTDTETRREAIPKWVK